MGRVIQLGAVYREGVLQPLEPLALAEDQQVVISVYVPEENRTEEMLREWAQVYSGLNEDEIRDIEAVTLERSNFSRDRE
jgi:predicted DNA-binding antitoxin AbrB/MazE fold protein